MLCNKCFDEVRNSIVGVTNTANETGKYVSLTPKNYFILSGNNAIPLYIKAEKPITKGNKKGEMKEFESVIFMKASFCAKCGTNMTIEETNKKESLNEKL